MYQLLTEPRLVQAVIIHVQNLTLSSKSKREGLGTEQDGPFS